MLLRRGDWTGTVVPIYVCVQRGCVTWPRYYRSVRKLNICHRQIDIQNDWYRFIEPQFYHHACHGTISLTADDHEGFHGMIATGYYSTYNDLLTNCYIQAYPSAALDFGSTPATVTIFGLDSNGMRLQTMNGDGTYSDGLVLTLASPYVQSSVLVSKIYRVLKDATQGDVRLYGYDPVNNVLYDLAVYAPSETNPNYARYQLEAGSRCNACGALALMKLAFVPALNDNDLVLIENFEALAYAMQAAKHDEAGDTDGANSFIVKAVGELNKDLRNDNLDEQISINLNPFGTAYPARHSIGHVF